MVQLSSNRFVRMGGAVLALLLICAAPVHARTLWGEAGEPRAAVVVPDEAHAIAKYAAQELVYHVELASGATLPLLTESEAEEDGAASEAVAHRIYVGETDAASRAGIDTEAGRERRAAARSARAARGAASRGRAPAHRQFHLLRPLGAPQLDR